MLLNASQTELDNGIRVVSASLPHLQSASIGVWAGVGGRHEPKSLCGVSHFIEHLLFKGTKKLSARDISQAIEGRGGYFNAFTQEDSTCYYARISRDYTWEVFDILRDMYLSPKFAVDDIARERGVILEEMMMYRDRPDHVAHEMLSAGLWKGHILGYPLVGTEKALNNMSRKDIIGFKTRRYVPGNTVIAFAGNVSHPECVKRVARAFGRLKPVPIPKAAPVTRSTRQTRAAVRNKKVEQTQLAMGFRIFGRHDRQKYILKVLNVILGGNMSSRLFQTVREKHGLAYSVHSQYQLVEETGAMVVSAGLEKAKGLKALALIVKELRRIAEKQPGADELARAKEYLTGQLCISMESPSSQMMWIGENTLNYGRQIQPEHVIKAINAVSAPEVSVLARRIFRPERATAAMVSPELEEKDARHIEKILGALA